MVTTLEKESQVFNSNVFATSSLALESSVSNSGVMPELGDPVKRRFLRASSEVAFSEPPLGTTGELGSNNTIRTANNLGLLNGNHTINGYVSSANDVDDYFRFDFGTTSNLSVSLSNLTSDADVRLIRDANSNGQADAGDVIHGSSRSGTATDSFNLEGLGAGTYFVRVNKFGSGSTNYRLSMTGTPGLGRETGSNNTLGTANDLATLNGTRTIGGYVSSANDVNDYFRFRLGTTSNLSVSLSRISSDADLRLIRDANNNGVVDGDEVIESSIRSGTATDSISLRGIPVGTYFIRVNKFGSGSTNYNLSLTGTPLSFSRINGTFRGETLNYSPSSSSNRLTLMLGRGGTDTLNLAGISRSDVVNLNGGSLSTFNPFTSTARQVIFGGTAWDYLTLRNGREIYFQGIENLRFRDGSLNLQVRTNDTHFGRQWNLHTSDVTSAWRFTRGSSNVLLASLDTGILTASGARGGIVDINTGRLVTDPSDDDNDGDYGHGHSAISVMASTWSNRFGVAGINGVSRVYVNDVYNGVNLQQAIRDTIAYARARGMRVVFQGGIQGEGWLTSGGTQAQLEQLIRDNRDVAMFAIAAGNGGPGGNLDDPNYLTSVSGVAKLQTNHNNVISVGALQHTATTVNNLENASTVNLASYSNRGSNLTLVAATDSPAMDKFGNMRIFGGTSAANPNMAGIASLVWSVNSRLTGGEVRQILIDTAMDLGTTGRDNTFGHGLVNADAAVRRAVALARNRGLANLYSGQSVIA